MDKRLEKIRRYEASVKDLESYINDKIKETKDGKNSTPNENQTDNKK